ncbi:MAG: hypothetical protein SFZ03_10000 [Candidatus Melainabacteria bacterium]|nr:hypothetical protein [Candidatus Melainabacteria bacterium]
MMQTQMIALNAGIKASPRLEWAAAGHNEPNSAFAQPWQQAASPASASRFGEIVDLFYLHQPEQVVNPDRFHGLPQASSEPDPLLSPEQSTQEQSTQEPLERDFSRLELKALGRMAIVDVIRQLLPVVDRPEPLPNQSSVEGDPQSGEGLIRDVFCPASRPDLEIPVTSHYSRAGQDPDTGAPLLQVTETYEIPPALSPFAIFPFHRPVQLEAGQPAQEVPVFRVVVGAEDVARFERALGQSSQEAMNLNGMTVADVGWMAHHQLKAAGFLDPRAEEEPLGFDDVDLAGNTMELQLNPSESDAVQSPWDRAEGKLLPAVVEVPTEPNARQQLLNRLEHLL